jgi:predicted DNA-binding protein with PD1-like motif
MKAKLLNDDQQKTYALIFDKDDEVMAGLKQFAVDNQLLASQFTAIGGFSDVMLGFYEVVTKDYKRIPVNEQVEVLTLTGDITLKPDGDFQVHAHAVIGMSDGTAKGGHLLSASVFPTLEVILTESPAYLRRQMDAETGIALIRL